MNRRRFFELLAAPCISSLGTAFSDLFLWRLHILARATCEHGPVIYLIVQGKQYELTPRERAYITGLADGLAKMETPHLTCTVDL